MALGLHPAKRETWLCLVSDVLPDFLKMPQTLNEMGKQEKGHKVITSSAKNPAHPSYQSTTVLSFSVSTLSDRNLPLPWKTCTVRRRQK